MHRFLKSIEYIEANLFERIAPDEIAQIACFSTFHYCRLFKALIGDSVMGYIRKRRLSIAAQRLACEREEIMTVALTCQFESHEAFTRAFKKMFHVTPKEFKSLHNPDWINFRKPIDQKTLEHLQNGVSMEPKFVQKNSFQMVGINGTYTRSSAQDIPTLWQQFIPKIPVITHRINLNSTYGICRPLNHNEFEYIAAVEVQHLNHIPQGMVGHASPSQNYAVFTHKGHIRDFAKTVSYIWATWLPNSGLETTGTADIEHYDERFDPIHLTGEVDIYIPITNHQSRSTL